MNKSLLTLSVVVVATVAIASCSDNHHTTMTHNTAGSTTTNESSTTGTTLSFDGEIASPLNFDSSGNSSDNLNYFKVNNMSDDAITSILGLPNSELYVVSPSGDISVVDGVTTIDIDVDVISPPLTTTQNIAAVTIVVTDGDEQITSNEFDIIIAGDEQL